MLGTSAITQIGGYVAGTNISDGRFKTQVTENVPGLDFILKLRPVTYHLNARQCERFAGHKDADIEKLGDAYDAAEKKVRTGFIAQEVEQAAAEVGYDFSGVYKPQNDKDAYGLAYSEFTVPLVKAVQEQQKTIAELHKQLAELMKRLEEVEGKK